MTFYGKYFRGPLGARGKIFAAYSTSCNVELDMLENGDHEEDYGFLIIFRCLLFEPQNIFNAPSHF